MHMYNSLYKLSHETPNLFLCERSLPFSNYVIQIMFLKWWYLKSTYLLLYVNTYLILDQNWTGQWNNNLKFTNTKVPNLPNITNYIKLIQRSDCDELNREDEKGFSWQKNIWSEIHVMILVNNTVSKNTMYSNR